MAEQPQDVQATYCATLVDEWVTRGVGHAVVAPGSRSTPMALAIAARPEIELHVVHDERSAGFAALGLGLGGIPALLLCTSGTAAANFFPAVVEAALSDVPMIVLTADRPEELRGVGAPQTIDQVDLYGKHVRWARDPGVADDGERSLWRELAADAWQHSSTGPVQLNLAFREPLLGTPGPLPVDMLVASEGRPTRRFDQPPPAMGTERGVILAGGRSGVSPDEVAALQAATGWPIVADPVSEMRHLDGVVAYADALLRSPEFADEHAPDVIVRIGRPAASKFLAQWSARRGITMIQVGGPGVIDPDHNVSAVCAIADLLQLSLRSRGAGSEGDRRFRGAGSEGTSEFADRWLEGWLRADRRADQVIRSTFDDSATLTEPAVARCLADNLPPDARLTVASSMPVRDLEWFGGHRARAHANRGANGIDGVTSTALGIALDGTPSVLLIGDLAFVHDSSALVGLAARGVDLRIVVVDNDGGGIFSFLPQARELPADGFERLFGTPLGVDVIGLAAAHGLPAHDIDSATVLAAQLLVPGPWVARVPSHREHNVDVHDALHESVRRAVAP